VLTAFVLSMPMLFFSFPPLSPLLLSSQRLVNFFLLLVHQECLHGVVVVMLGNQLLQIPLLFQHRSILFLIVITVVIIALFGQPFRSTLLAAHIFPSDLALLGVIVIAWLISRMVNPDHPTADSCAAEIVNREVGTPLVLVLEPPEAARLACLLVASEFEKCRFAELREDRQNVSLGELKWEAAEVDKGGITVIGVPGGFGRPEKQESAICGERYSDWYRILTLHFLTRVY
jgi:hypothetical protein